MLYDNSLMDLGIRKNFDFGSPSCDWLI